MSFSYDPTDAVYLATDLGRVRRRVGDTIAADHTWEDEEIADALASAGSVDGAVSQLLASVPGEEAGRMMAANPVQVAVLSGVRYRNDPYDETLLDAERVP
jgi:hypothetical protein